MNYNFGMPMFGNYGGYQQQQQQPQMMQGNYNMPQQGGDSRIWVQGEIGAKSYIIAPGNVVPLWDSESQTIWIKSVAQNGVPAMQKITYSFDQQQTAPVQNVAYVTREEFERRIAELVKPQKEEKKHE